MTLKKGLLTVALVLSCALPTTSCYTMTHRVGNGGTGSQVMEQRQWYWLWGLAKINTVDTQQMAAGATDYTVKTEQNVLDVIITLFTSWISIVPFTETVTK